MLRGKKAHLNKWFAEVKVRIMGGSDRVFHTVSRSHVVAHLGQTSGDVEEDQ